MRSIIWIRDRVGNEHKTAKSFLRAALVEKAGIKAKSLKLDAVVAGLRRFFFVVKIIRTADGVTTFSKSRRSSSWGNYQVGYVLLDHAISDKELQNLIDKYMREIENSEVGNESLS